MVSLEQIAHDTHRFPWLAVATDDDLPFSVPRFMRFPKASSVASVDRTLTFSEHAQVTIDEIATVDRTRNVSVHVCPIHPQEV